MTLSDKDLRDSYQIDMPVNDTVHLDVGYIDNFVDGQGITFLHYRAIPCPVGLGDPYDIRKIHEDHEGCSNGFIYEYAGEVVCTFVGNGKQFQWQDVGLTTDASAQVTVSRYYNNTQDEVFLSPNDRFYLKESKALVVTFQKFEHNQSGFDRVRFPVVAVELLIDSDGKRYGSGDFTVTNGQIQWLGKNRPSADPKTGKGQACAIRYRYVPFWYVSRILHEIRVVQAVDPATGVHGTQRMPSSVLLQREYMFQNEDNDPRAPDPSSGRQVTAARRGSFGPR